MINLNQYIFEKLKIDKFTKIDKYLFVVPYGKIWEYFDKRYKDYRIDSNTGDPSGFVLEYDEAIKESKISKKRYPKESIEIYYPDEDYEILDFIDAYKEGEITLEDLEEYKLDEEDD